MLVENVSNHDALQIETLDFQRYARIMLLPCSLARGLLATAAITGIFQYATHR